MPDQPNIRSDGRSRFNEKVVIVAGAAQGMGLVTAEMFAREGARVVAIDASPAVSASWMKVQQAVPGADGFAIQCDVTDGQACERATRATIDRYGKVDVLAFLAGVLQQANPVVDLPVEEWDRVMNVNVKGAMLMCRAVVPHMMAKHSGRVVTISSWYGHSGHALFSAYCASKAALKVFTQCLAAETAEYGITANCICPGNINTSMHQNALAAEAAKRGVTFEEMKSTEWAKIPLGKAGDPEEIARGLLFLASDDAAYITGASLDINGGVLFH
jgi:3-oxoacyl-[acyl-carrier protein] reductase